MLALIWVRTAWTAEGLLAAIVAAVSKAQAVSWSRSMTRLTRPIRSAKAASTSRPVTSRPSAWPWPSWWASFTAAPEARFGLPEVRWSSYPFGGATVNLAHQIGHVHAMDLLLTGRLVDAAFAERVDR